MTTTELIELFDRPVLEAIIGLYNKQVAQVIINSRGGDKELARRSRQSIRTTYYRAIGES